MVCPCCNSISYFNRNSLARASGISADSGFCHLDALNSEEVEISNLPLKSMEHSNYMEYSDVKTTPTFYRNMSDRWSEGRISFERPKRRRELIRSSITSQNFTRNSSINKQDLENSDNNILAVEKLAFPLDINLNLKEVFQKTQKKRSIDRQRIETLRQQHFSNPSTPAKDNIIKFVLTYYLLNTNFTSEV